MDARKILATFILVLLSGLQIATADSSSSFRGAVVEYGAKYSNKSSKENVLLNVNSYKTIVENLKEQYDDLAIIVFPENGLSSNPRDVYAEEVPHPSLKEIPCDNNKTEALKTLSCVAKKNKVYLVVNLVEKSPVENQTYIYNTNVVFSRDGTIVARYRKFNIYGYEGKPFHRTKKPEISYFDTDFGVRFGTFTCFDIDFKSPALDLVNENNVTHIAFPTAWISELPFLTAVQVQSGWAHATNTILLASGYNDPQSGSTGTGIYFGKLKYESFEELSLQNQIKGDFAIVSDIPKSPNDLGEVSKTDVVYFYDTSNPLKAPLKLLKDHLQHYTTELVKQSDDLNFIPESHNLLVENNLEVNKTVCDRGLCCEFYFNIKRQYGINVMINVPDFNGDAFGYYDYRLAVFNGVRSYGGGIATGGVQVCSIISCLNHDSNSCGIRTEDGDPTTVSLAGVSFKQYHASFYDVTIKATLKSSNNTFVASNILLSSSDTIPKLFSENLLFGKTVDPALFDVSKISEGENDTSVYLFESKGDINNPASINLYNRVFEWDGQNVTGSSETFTSTTQRTISKGSLHKITLELLVISITVLMFISKSKAI